MTTRRTTTKRPASRTTTRTPSQRVTARPTKTEITVTAAEANVPVLRDAPPPVPEVLALVPATGETYGLTINYDAGIYVRYTPLGDGRWRCESNAYEQEEIVDGPAVTHNGQYLLLRGLFIDPMGHPYWDGTPLAPALVTKDAVD